MANLNVQNNSNAKSTDLSPYSRRQENDPAVNASILNLYGAIRGSAENVDEATVRREIRALKRIAIGNIDIQGISHISALVSDLVNSGFTGLGHRLAGTVLDNTSLPYEKDTIKAAVNQLWLKDFSDQDIEAFRAKAPELDIIIAPHAYVGSNFVDLAAQAIHKAQSWGRPVLFKFYDKNVIARAEDTADGLMNETLGFTNAEMEAKTTDLNQISNEVQRARGTYGLESFNKLQAVLSQLDQKLGFELKPQSDFITISSSGGRLDLQDVINLNLDQDFVGEGGWYLVLSQDGDKIRATFSVNAPYTTSRVNPENTSPARSPETDPLPDDLDTNMHGDAAALDMQPFKAKLKEIAKDPNTGDHLGQVYNLWADRIRGELVPVGVAMSVVLLFADLESGIDGYTNKPIAGNVIGLPPQAYRIFFAHVKRTIKEIFPADFAEQAVASLP